MAVYINGLGIISPSGFSGSETFSDWEIPQVDSRMKCIEPEYGSFIEVKAIRRMSRIIKMGVSSSLMALKEAKVESPEAVIVGTALGCLEDTVSFLNKLVINKEELLNPTAFIHSTHNTIASQIALNVKCMGYNSTYVHRNISFETALLDAFLMLNEKSVGTVLVGGIDELTDESFVILQRLGYYANKLNSGNRDDDRSMTAGEGSAFFFLSNEIMETSYARLADVCSVSFSSKEKVLETAKRMLNENGLDKVDLVLSGSPGSTDPYGIASAFSKAQAAIHFKEFCGEYPTAGAFGMYVGASILQQKKLPANLNAVISMPAEPRHILIHNNFREVHHSLILLSAC